MKHAAILLFLFIFTAGCGDLAPNDATVSGPEDSVKTLSFSASSSAITYHPLDFIAKNKAGVVLADIEMELFRGGIEGGVSLLDKDGNLVAEDNTKGNTNERGIRRAGLQLTVPGCTTTTDIKASGSVLATVGSSSYLWTATVTRSCTP